MLKINMSHFNAMVHWSYKAQKMYGFEKIHYEYESFDIDLSEQYRFSFVNENR